MNKLITACLLFLHFNMTNAIQQGETFKLIEDSFDIKLSLKQLNEDTHQLNANIELADNSYIISPFSTDQVYGHFSLTIEKNEFLTVHGTLTEHPTAKEEWDPIISHPVKFVRVNTTYGQALKVNSKENFEVKGLIEFVIEPACIPYDVEFLLSYHNEKLTVKKTKTSISSEYRQ